jgi:hypothetical protein
MTDPESFSKRDEQQEKTWFKIQMQKTWFQGLVFAGGVLVYFLFGLVLWCVLDLYINPQDSGEKKDLIQALGLIMAGLAGIVGIWFTWRNLSNAQDQLTNTQAQLQLARQGQITDRFTKAIDQMGDTNDGSKRLEIRIGGIYALERIAQDSVQYYGQIMEILTAYIRENSPWPPKEASQLPSAESKAHEWSRWRKTESVSFITGATTDVQAVLDVFVRREEARVPTAYRLSFDLTGTDLRGANLLGINLAGANLVGANLQGAWLAGANLEGANLRGVNLQQTWLSDARLTRANLTDARLEGAHLSGATISYPSLQIIRLFGPEELAETGSIEVGPSDFSETKGLVQEQLELSLGDDSVKLPQGVQNPDIWVLDNQEQIETVREQMKEQVSRESHIRTQETAQGERPGEGSGHRGGVLRGLIQDPASGLRRILR